METQKEKRLRLWKARQEAEGYDVSGVTTLQEAEHFFDKKVEPEAPEEPKVPELPEEPEAVEAPEEPKEPGKPKRQRATKPKEV